MKKTREEFIRKAHKEACAEWQIRIEGEFPKLFKADMEVGKWYKIVSRCNIQGGVDALICYSGKNQSFGFNFMGDWTNVFITECLMSQLVTPATNEEVETALIKEAEKREFKEDTMIMMSAGANKHIDSLSGDTGGIGLFNKTLTGLDSKNVEGWIFLDGEWAKIIKTITKAEAEKQLGKTIIG